MAKKQSFSDKTGKKAASKNRIKLIRSAVSDKTGAVRFSEDILPVPDGKTPETVIKEFIASK
ncbi:MAG: hypothetical protein CMG50_03140 [Candidatus Marinimicrobia bacterium]|nr:hypothetical protein [Candidatus Neomarinimicrobiota bacterium]|tara:strand:+ start:6551 stop:6736 length:186 start_codon:yes stop_codon:yes gene_type:complete